MMNHDNYIAACIGFDCNNNCINCMLSPIMDRLVPLDFNEYKKLLTDVVIKKEFNSLILSGAEVTLKSDLCSFVHYAKQLNYFKHIRIQTNGRMLKDIDFTKNLVETGIDEYFVSIYGPGSDIHDKVTRTTGSFDDTIKGIANLEQLGMTVITNTVVTKINYKSLRTIVSLLGKYDRVKEIHFWNYWPMNLTDKEDLLVSLKVVLPFLQNASRKGNKLGKRIVLKDFPVCVLGEQARNVNNEQAQTIIDDTYWELYKSNRFYTCLYRGICAEKKCTGLTHAYVDKYGWEEDFLKPLGKEDVNNNFTFQKRHSQLEKYKFHLEEFGLAQGETMVLFEKLLNDSSDFYIDCSIKHENQKSFAGRINIWYEDDDHRKNLNLIFDFFKSVERNTGHAFNYEILKQVFNRHIDLSRIKQVVTGVDVRDDEKKSRLKIWFIIKDYTEKLNQVLELHGYDDSVMDLVIKDEMLFGVDLGFNGTTGIKLYNMFHHSDLENILILARLKKIFSPRILQMILQSKMFNVTFRGSSFRKFLHFTPHDTDSFVKELKYNPASELYDKVRGNMGNGVISLYEDEINSEAIKNFNFYY